MGIYRQKNSNYLWMRKTINGVKYRYEEIGNIRAYLGQGGFKEPDNSPG